MNEEWKTNMKIDDETKALIQVRKSTGTNLLHLQAFGDGGELNNREYGYADRFSVPPVVTDAILEYGADLYPSLTSAQEVYFRDVLSVHGYSDGVQLHINIPSTEWNSPDGFVLDLPAQRFSAFIAHIEAVGLLTNHEGEQRFVAPLQEEE